MLEEEEVAAIVIIMVEVEVEVEVKLVDIAILEVEVAMAEMRKARIKRQQSSHIFVCPRLCTTLWQRQLYKCADFVFELPVGSTVWPASMHEPLLIGVLFPFLSVKPWQLRGTPKMYAVGRELRLVFQTPGLDPRDLLRKFWSASLGLQHLPECVVRRMLFIE